MRLNPTVRRDVAIMRFIYTFETISSAARLYLSHFEGVDTNSPKSCIRACLEAGLLTPDETRVALLMADDRNLTAHTYNEDLADELYSRLPRHAEVLGAWLKAMKVRLAKSR